MPTIANLLWIGRLPQTNGDITSPASTADGEQLIGRMAAGTDQITQVDLSGEARSVDTSTGSFSAFATTYTDNPDGPSDMTYVSPADDQPTEAQISGFFVVRFQVTLADGTTSQQDGYLIQMDNGDTFLPSTGTVLPDGADFSDLASIEVTEVYPLPIEGYVGTDALVPRKSDIPSVPCFVSGTMIRTPQGDRAIEDLTVGDMVWTRDNGFQPLRWTGSRSLDEVDLAHRPQMMPIVIAAGALGAGIPAQDLSVSPQHRVLVRSAIAQRMFGTSELLAHAKDLLGIEGIAADQSCTAVTYHHLMCDRHEILMANGAETESLYLGSEAIRALGATAMAEINAIFPQLTEEGSPEAARPLGKGSRMRRLAERHARNGQPLAG